MTPDQAAQHWIDRAAELKAENEKLELRLGNCPTCRKKDAHIEQWMRNTHKAKAENEKLRGVLAALIKWENANESEPDWYGFGHVIDLAEQALEGKE